MQWEQWKAKRNLWKCKPLGRGRVWRACPADPSPRSSTVCLYASSFLSRWTLKQPTLSLSITTIPLLCNNEGIVYLYRARSQNAFDFYWCAAKAWWVASTESASAKTCAGRACRWAGWARDREWRAAWGGGRAARPDCTRAARRRTGTSHSTSSTRCATRSLSIATSATFGQQKGNISIRRRLHSIVYLSWLYYTPSGGGATDFALDQEHRLTGIGARGCYGSRRIAQHGWYDLGLALEAASDNPVARQPDLRRPLIAARRRLHLSQLLQKHWLALRKSG